MYEQFFAQRLNQLRQQQNISAREMSLALGQNESYINRIENGRAFPSMQAFFYICEYLNVSPAEFFDGANAAPRQLQQASRLLKSFTPAQLDALLTLFGQPQ